jgi:BolA protein
MKNIIEEKLKKELEPEFLEVVNNSHLHSGHAGDDGSGNTHFAVVVKAEKLNGLSKVNAHRVVNKILAEEFLGTLHALEIKIT